MTEAQLQLFPEFRALPIYDESDERADSITAAVADGRPRAIRECFTLIEVGDCLKNPKLVPLGGLRVGQDGNQAVVAYFAEGV